MLADVVYGSFVWNARKERANAEQHGIRFTEAVKAFLDPNRVIAVDASHGREEERFFCIGKVEDRVATVRFTYRANKIRIIGAGYWRKGRKLYEKKKKD